MNEIYDMVEELAERLRDLKREKEDLCEQLHREDSKEEMQMIIDTMDDALYHIRKAREYVEDLL